MLRQIHLENYRGFRSHTIGFRDKTVIVGKNNAGKSTIVEALRILSILADRYKYLNFQEPTGELTGVTDLVGVSPSLRGSDIDLANVCYRYSDPPARIDAEFSGGESATIFLAPDNSVHAILKDARGTLISTKSQAGNFILPDVQALPQVGPLNIDERTLTERYVKRNLTSSLSPLHFRNQLFRMREEYEEFKKLAEQSWHGLRLREIELSRANGKPRIIFIVQDGPFSAEIGWMGHGLQIWLQIMWFLARTTEAPTIILDEPDVYLHADLQRKLMRHLLRKESQVITTTHSVEMMQECAPERILVADRFKGRSSFATSAKAVQYVVDHIGSASNLALARLWGSKRLLFVEGKDVDILNILHSKIYPDSEISLTALPGISIGGWGGWHYALGSSMFLKNEVGEQLMAYCILDSDYHSDSEKERKYDEAKSRNISLHIWNMKEIENYLLCPAAIARYVNSESSASVNCVTDSDVTVEIDRICERLYEDTLYAVADEIARERRDKSVKGAVKIAKTRLEKVWSNLYAKVRVVSGKLVISELSKWAQEQCKVGLNANRIARTMYATEIPLEVKAVIRAIEECRWFGAE